MKMITHICCVAVLSMIPLQSALAGTAYLSGRVFLDDDGNYMYDRETDSNGVEDSHEFGLNGQSIYFLDPQTNVIIFGVGSDIYGDWDTEIESGNPMIVFMKPWEFPGVGPDLIMTTDWYHLIEPEDGEEIVIPSFGYGPIGPF